MNMINCNIGNDRSRDGNIGQYMFEKNNSKMPINPEIRRAYDRGMAYENSKNVNRKIEFTNTNNDNRSASDRCHVINPELFKKNFNVEGRNLRGNVIDLMSMPEDSYKESKTICK